VPPALLARTDEDRIGGCLLRRMSLLRARHSAAPCGRGRYWGRSGHQPGG
jgi:hypothetical protein